MTNFIAWIVERLYGIASLIAIGLMLYWYAYWITIAVRRAMRKEPLETKLILTTPPPPSKRDKEKGG